MAMLNRDQIVELIDARINDFNGSHVIPKFQEIAAGLGEVKVAFAEVKNKFDEVESNNVQQLGEMERTITSQLKTADAQFNQFQ